MKKGNKFSAFTLAEVLITLGVIGIVAALVLPNAIAQHRERENATKLKTVFSTITQAYTRAVTEFGTPEFWDLYEKDSSEGAQNINRIISPYFNVTQNCSTNGGCWYDGIIIGLNSDKSGSNYSTDSKYSTFSTVDGIQFAFNVEDAKCEGVFGTSRALEHVCATFTVDVNGKKHPNQYGYDVFKFYITSFGIQPYGLLTDTTYSFSDNCSKQYTGYGCAAWVVYNANMDYLHCSGLEWGGKTKCKALEKVKYDNYL